MLYLVDIGNKNISIVFDSSESRILEPVYFFFRRDVLIAFCAELREILRVGISYHLGIWIMWFMFCLTLLYTTYLLYSLWIIRNCSLINLIWLKEILFNHCYISRNTSPWFPASHVVMCVNVLRLGNSSITVLLCSDGAM